MNDRKRTALLLLSAILLLSFCSCGRKEAKLISAEETTALASEQDDALSGRAEAGKSVEVVSKLSGTVSEVFDEAGADVEKGQSLFCLDARDLSANVDAAKASLNNAQIVYAAAKDDEARAKELQTNGALSLVAYENTANALDRAKASADLAQAALDKASISYGDSKISSPISGTVSELDVKAGELVSPQIKAVRIIDLDTMTIKLYVKEKKINSFEVGKVCKVSVPAASDKNFEGTVINMSGAMDASSKGYLVEISVGNPDHLIKDGMFASIQQ